MRVLLVLLIVCVVAAQGYRKNQGDAFCNPNLTLADAIETEYLVFVKAITKVNASIAASVPLVLSKFDKIIAEKLTIFDGAGKEITAAQNSLNIQLYPYLGDPDIPDVSAYKDALRALIEQLETLIGIGEDVVKMPFEQFKSNYSEMATGLEGFIISVLEETFPYIVGTITEGNTTCLCKSLRHMNKVALDLVNAAIECGDQNIAGLIRHSKAVNKLLINSKLTALEIIQDGKDCLLNVARKTNQETKSMLNSCLIVQTAALRDFIGLFSDAANTAFAASAAKTILLKNKFYRCMQTASTEFRSLFKSFQIGYDECRGISTEAAAISLSANAWNLLALNTNVGLDLYNLLTLPNQLGK